MKRAAVIVVVFIVTTSILLSGPFLNGQTPAPTTQPEEKKASVSPDAQRELDALSQAYKNLKSLELTGAIRAEFDVAGEQVNQEAKFNSSYQSPGKFRHEMNDDIIVGSTGDKIYAFKARERLYIMKDAPEEGADVGDLAGPIPDVLKLQNPSLLLAMSNDPAAKLETGANSIDKIPDEAIDGNPHRVLEMKSDTGNVRVLVDPKTSLIRRMIMDVSPIFAARGQKDVKKAQVTLDYDRINLDGALPAEQFAWSPPENARDASLLMSAIGGSSAEALKGKPAPDFTLPDLNDKPVKLSELRGQVVVLDFWASWCGPCVASMPTLAAMHKEFSQQGVKVYAVNIGEDKELVGGFLTSRNLDLPVLLDQERQTADNYGIEGIPTTLVIDRSGIVRNVHVGMPPDGEAQLRREIAAALKDP